MVVTFGSVGDIIAVSLLVKDLASTLNSSTGAAAEYREVVRELYVLDTALSQVVHFVYTPHETPELHALCETALRSVDKAKICVSSFTNHIKKYQASLQEGGSGNKVKDAARSVQWQLGRGTLDRFRAEITSHSEALNMLLVTAQIAIQKADKKTVLSLMASAETSAQAARDQQNTVLSELRDNVEKNQALIADGKTVAQRTWERCQWIAQLGAEMKTYMFSIMWSNVAIYRRLVAVQKTLESPKWSLCEEPFWLEDAAGRGAPVHLSFITSWKAFESVLQVRFENSKGYKKIAKGDYVLQEDSTAREVKRNGAWEGAFLPGQRIVMSVLIRREEEPAAVGIGPQKFATCPYCQTSNEGAPDVNTRCVNCRKWFCRVVKLRQDATQDGSDDFSDQARLATSAGFVSPDWSNDEEDSDITAFMRIRIQATQSKKPAFRRPGKSATRLQREYLTGGDHYSAIDRHRW